MPINPDAVGATSEPVEHSWASKDALLYALGVGAGHRRRAGLHHREHQRRRPSRCCPPWPWCSAWAAAAPTARSAVQPGDARARRAGASSCTGPSRSRATVVHGRRDHGHLRQGQGRRRRAPSRCRPTSATGEPLFTNVMLGVHPRRGRLGRRPRPVRPAQRRARARARPRGHLPDPRRPGPDLPALRRPQPAALRPVVRRDGRLRPADPPRPVHLRLHRPGAAAQRCAAATRRGSRPWRAASRRRCSRARR